MAGLARARGQVVGFRAAVQKNIKNTVKRRGRLDGSCGHGFTKNTPLCLSTGCLNFLRFSVHSTKRPSSRANPDVI